LCEVCRKVFGERDFIDHMEDCKKLRLQRERQQLQRDIRDLNEEHRKSLSQLKRKNNENVLRDLTTNANNTPGKLQKKGSKVIKEPQERPGNFSQLIGNDYRSSKYF
jgi:phosphorylcholine metabolism protein LicD